MAGLKTVRTVFRVQYFKKGFNIYFMRVKKIYLVVLFLLGASSMFAQPTHSSDWLPPTAFSPYEKVNIQQIRKPIELPSINESDIMWAKWVWRRIELKEKINQKFYYPSVEAADRKSLASVLFDAVKSVNSYAMDDENPTGPDFRGTAFEGAYGLIAFRDDNFDKPYHNIEDIPVFGARTNLTGITDSLGRQTYDTLRVEARDVLSFQLRELWFFDKKRSQLDVRIVGICPEYRIKQSLGERPYENYEQNVWFYYPQARYYLCNKECYNPHNDAAGWSYDDIFLMRMFGSYIIKESNIHDRMITEFSKGVDAIIESERIKAEIIEFESQLWDY